MTSSRTALRLALMNPLTTWAKLQLVRRRAPLTILNLHRVAPEAGCLDPDLFRDLLEFVTRHFQPIVFSDLAAERRFDQPPMILSFDDAYLDFQEFAMPILREFGVRVNQNVIPRCAMTGLPPLNVMAQQFFERATAEEAAGMDIPGFDTTCETPRASNWFIRLSAHIKNRPIAEQNELANELVPKFLDRGAKFSPMMNEDAIRAAAKIHEIGLHSFEHASMAYESDQYFVDDLNKCQKWATQVLGDSATIYAFPNGSYRDGQIERARTAGYRHVLLVDETYSRVTNVVHARFTFHARSIWESRFRATGGLRFPS